MTKTLTQSTAKRDYLSRLKAMGAPADLARNLVRARTPLQHRQVLASLAARECDHPDGPTEVAYGGARGGGKSFWGLVQVGADDCQREPGLKALILRKVGRAGKESFGDLRTQVFRYLPNEYAQSSGVLRFPNGSRIHLGHFKDEKDIDAYLGLEYDVALIEEATTLSAAKITGIRSCVRTSKPNWRPRIYLTFNPGGIGHTWAKDRYIKPYKAKAERNTRYVPATAKDNAFLNSEYVEKTLGGLTGWLRRAWLDGDWDIAAGQYFTTWREGIHVVKPFPVPESWRAWIALDYGFTHYTVAYVMVLDDEGHLYIVGEHGERRWLVERHVTAIRAMLTRLSIEEHRLGAWVAGSDVFAKKQSGGTVADDYAKVGIKLKPANMDRINGAAELLRRLGDVGADPPIAPTMSIFSTCPRLIESIPSMIHDPNRPEDVLKVDTDDDGLGGDDFYDAARYGVMFAANRQKLRFIA
jgi:phage terminase large subunit